MKYIYRDFEISHNVRIKYIYDRNGNKIPFEVLCCSDNIFIDKGFEPYKKDVSCTHVNTSVVRDTDVLVNKDNAVRRSRKNIFDLIVCNHFEYFCTLTFNADIVNRSSYAECQKKFNQWFSNQVKRKSVKYVAVAEYHKKNKAIHYHVLLSGNLPFVDSGTVKVPHHKKPIKTETANRYNIPIEDRTTVYNIANWSYGFSTAIIIKGDDTSIKVANYLRKYITKDNDKIGGRYYYSGGDLIRPTYEYSDTDFREFDFDYDFSVAGRAFKCKRLL